MARTLTANEQAALGTSVAAGAKHARTWVRIEIHDGGPSGGTFVDLSNMFHGFRFGTDVDRTVIAGTILLSRSHTDTADTLSPLVTDALNAGRRVRLYVTTQPLGVTPTSGELQLVWDGVVDVVDAAGEIIELHARDWIGAILADRDMISEFNLTGATYTLEDILNAILYQAALDNATNVGLDHDIPTDFDASGVSIDTSERGLKEEPAKLLEVVRSTADRIGWQLRPRWNQTDEEFQLAFYAPPHAKSTVDWIIPPSRLLDFTRFSIDREMIRNAVRVSYIDAAGDRVTWPTTIPTGYLIPMHIDEDSIAEFGLRFMEISYEEYDPVRTAADAQSIADYALAELAWPLVEAEAEIMLNWAIDIDDRITFQADDVRTTSDQTWAVIGYEHSFDPKSERTRLQVRGKPTGGVVRWRNPAKAPANVQPPSGLTLTSDYVTTAQNDYLALIYRIIGSFTPSPDAFLDHYDVRYRQKLATEWIAAPPPPKDATGFVIAGGIGIDVYTVQMRAVNKRGFGSEWIEGDVTTGWVAANESGISVDLRFDTAGQLIADILGPPEWGYFLWSASNTSQPASGASAPSPAYTAGTLYTLNTGVNVPVGDEGYLTLNFYEDSSGAVVGPVVKVYATREAAFTPPSVDAAPSQSGATGTLTLTIADPDLSVTAVEYALKTGAGAFGAFTSASWNTSTGTPGTDATLVRAKNVTLDDKHNSAIAWRVTFETPGGIAQSYAGSHSFDSDLIANVTNIDISFSTTGIINVAAVGDEDTANMYFRAAAGSTPADPTNVSFNTSIAGRSGANSTGVSCGEGVTATVKGRAYDSLGNAGPIFTVSVVRPNVTATARAATTETIRSTTAPATRSDGTTLVQGDMWIETDAGNKPYIWSGAAWVAAYTAIDGGAITTGAITSVIYTPGSAGWAINTNGTVEFNSGTFRGDLVINTASAGYHVQVQTSGVTQGGIYAAQGVHGALVFFGRENTPTRSGMEAGTDASGDYVELMVSNGTGRLFLNPDQIGFFSGGVSAAKQTVTGSRGGNAALQSLLDALEAYGLITDSSS